MKLIKIIAFCLYVTPCLADFISPFDSTVPGIKIPNTHIVQVDSQNKAIALRGNTPRNLDDIKDLMQFGIKNILIFKKQSKKEVDHEIKNLLSLGFPKKNITHIPFKWKEIKDFKTPCLQTVQALKIISDSVKAHEKIFFHCTVGEDRTGYLSAIQRVLLDKWSPHKAYRKEMCENGFGSGNPEKPIKKVVENIRLNLTPLFAKMSFLIDKHGKLDASLCGKDPEKIPAYLSSPFYQMGKLKCPGSSKYKKKKPNT